MKRGRFYRKDSSAANSGKRDGPFTMKKGKEKRNLEEQGKEKTYSRLVGNNF